MKRVYLICGLGVVGLLAAAAGFWHLWHSRALLDATLSETRADLHQSREALASRTQQAEALVEQLTGARTESEAIRSQLAAAEARAITLSRELSEVRTQFTDQTATLQQREAALDELKKELIQSRLNGAAALNAGLEEHRRTIRQLEQDLLEAQTRAAPAAPEARAMKVLSVGPADAFVVLDYGSTRGAAVNQQLLVRRDSASLATVTISDVRENHSIAQVMAASLRGSLRPGDPVTLLP